MYNTSNNNDRKIGGWTLEPQTRESRGRRGEGHALVPELPDLEQAGLRAHVTLLQLVRAGHDGRAAHARDTVVVRLPQAADRGDVRLEQEVLREVCERVRVMSVRSCVSSVNSCVGAMLEGDTTETNCQRQKRHSKQGVTSAHLPKTRMHRRWHRSITEKSNMKPEKGLPDTPFSVMTISGLSAMISVHIFSM